MSSEKNRHLVFLARVFMVMVLAALACNAPRGTTPPTGIPSTSTVPREGGASPTPFPPPSVTDTPVPDVSGPGGCTLNAAYVADVTVPDDTEFDPGAAFTKVWRVRNSGTCEWEAGTRLIFVSGERMGGPAAVDVPQVAPGSDTDVGVDLVAPTLPGTYRSTWRLQGPDGVRFGARVYVQIVVPEATVEPTEESALPDLVITNLELDTGAPRQGIPLHVVATLRNQGGSTAEDLHWAWRICVQDRCPYTEAPGEFTLEPGEEVTAQLEYLFGSWITYTTEAWVDSREEIEESDETNNTRQLVIPVKASLPDMVVTAAAFDLDPPIQGQATTTGVSIHDREPDGSAAFVVELWNPGTNGQMGMICTRRNRNRSNCLSTAAARKTRRIE